MIVSKEELEELQGFVQKQIKELQKSGDSDSDQEFNLQALDSNISLVISCGELQECDAIELGTRDYIIKDALEAYRNDISEKSSEDSYVGTLSFYASEAANSLQKAKESLPSDEKIFSANINWKLNQILPVIKEIAGLQGNARLVQKLKLNDFEAMEAGTARSAGSVKTVRISAAASSSAVSVSSSSSAVETAEKKTRKSPAKEVKEDEKASKVKSARAKISETSSKTASKASSKTGAKSASVKSASKITAKTASAKTKASSKTEKEVSKKRGRPRKTEA